jgi:hypothetical protein
MTSHHSLRPAIAEQSLRERRELEERDEAFARERVSVRLAAWTD